MNPGSVLSWFGRRSVGAKVAIGIGAFVAVGAVANAVESASTPAVAPSHSVSVVPSPSLPLVSTKRLTTVVVLPFKRTTVDDSSLDKGQRRLATQGIAGKKTVVYELTLENDTEVSRRKVSEVITLQPVDEVTAVGTYVRVAPKPQPQPASNSCDPNYAGACVPIASDVDCAGGSGNGPAYVQGPVRVVGTDIYGLDRDGDGIGCE